jgi:hypothetical protein
MAFTVVDGAIVEINTIADPDRVHRIAASVLIETQRAHGLLRPRFPGNAEALMTHRMCTFSCHISTKPRTRVPCIRRFRMRARTPTFSARLSHAAQAPASWCPVEDPLARIVISVETHT